jgi:hypothetical protein
MPKKQIDIDYPQPEAEKRRDDLLKRLLHTPPKPRPTRDRGGKISVTVNLSL